MTDYSDLKLAVEIISGGKNTVLIDKFGLPSVVVPIVKMTYKDVGVGESEDVLPAFMINNKEIPYFCMGKYLDSVINGVPCSLPMRDPGVGVNATEAISQSRSKGEGWCVATNAMYAAIALWCRKNGSMPSGNNNQGASYEKPWEKGIPSNYRKDNGAPFRTFTGSGPVSWNHNNDATGICDLNGNVNEIIPDLRMIDAEIQFIPYDNAALSTIDLGEGSKEWKALNAKGEFVDPGTDGTIKVDSLNDNVALTTSAVSTTKEYQGSNFGYVQNGPGLEVPPQLLYGLGLLPYEYKGDYGNDSFWTFFSGSHMPTRSGRGGYGPAPGNGVFFIDFRSVRTVPDANMGRRSAFVGTVWKTT